MDAFENLSAMVGTNGGVCLATILCEQGERRWLAELTTGEHVTCMLLMGSTAAAWVSEGAKVLVCFADENRSQGFVLGVVEAPVAAASAVEPERAVRATDGSGVSDYLVIEAKKGLTLKVGDGSITIREDGRILIKGQDLVSHARRMNRIKGGAVSIN